jgi:hypothetical protein
MIRTVFLARWPFGCGLRLRVLAVGYGNVYIIILYFMIFTQRSVPYATRRMTRDADG